jgi:MFS family permease
LLGPRANRRFGVGPCILFGLIGFTVGNALIPLAPAGSIAIAVALLVGQQLIGDVSATIEEITEVSLVQTTVPNELLGRVNGTYNFLTHLFLLVGTIGAGLIGEWVGLRQAMMFGLLGGIAAVILVWLSPLRTLRDMPAAPTSAIVPGIDIPLSE